MLAAAMSRVGGSTATEDVLNFMVIGELRSGAAVAQSSIDGALGAVCHSDLLHPKEAVRRRCHCLYFGKPEDSGSDWFVTGTNPHQYLNHQIFDHPLRGEATVGMRILYPQIRKYELYDFIQERSSAGSFCVIHVVRNPITCFVSFQQSRQSRVWSRSPQDPPQTFLPAPVTIQLEELIPFVRDHYSVRAKIDRSCPDCHVVHYHELFTDFGVVMRGVYRFLEIPEQTPAPATRRRLWNRAMRARIANFDVLYRTAPRDIRELLDNDLF